MLSKQWSMRKMLRLHYFRYEMRTITAQFVPIGYGLTRLIHYKVIIQGSFKHLYCLKFSTDIHQYVHLNSTYLI